jgi:N-acetylglutamate synthase-like GNAT family acetyltransferase
MALVWTDSIDGIDWNELAALYLAAPLAKKDPADLRRAFSNSMFTRFALEDGKLVAAGRVLADGVDVAYLCDVALLPGYQGRGLGSIIVADLLALARGHKKIFLYSVPGKEGFYARLGFRRMTTAMAIFDDQDAAIRRGYLEGD